MTRLGFGPLAHAVAPEAFASDELSSYREPERLGEPCPICGDPMIRKTITTEDGTVLTHDRCDDDFQFHPVSEPPR